MTELIFADYPVRGVDVSQFNGKINFDKLAKFGCSYVVIRSSYGVVADSKFKENWSGAKGKIPRRQYHYLDYYSNYITSSYVYGMSDSDWGKKQAQFAYNLTSADNDGSIIFLDIEKASFAPTIESVLSRVIVIAVSFYAELDRLNNKLNGAYLSAAAVKLFAKSLGKRPLWVAWYNENQTIQAVINYARASGWTGEIWTWQYASDGDTDDDGIGDGIIMGMGVPYLDLNIELTEGTVPTLPPPNPTTPKTKIVEVGVTLVQDQNLRQSPYGKLINGITLPSGREIELLGYGKDIYGNPWVRVGYSQWAAVTFNGKNFIKILTTQGGT